MIWAVVRFLRLFRGFFANCTLGRYLCNLVSIKTFVHCFLDQELLGFGGNSFGIARIICCMCAFIIVAVATIFVGRILTLMSLFFKVYFIHEIPTVWKLRLD